MSRNTKQQEMLQRNRKGAAMQSVSLNQQEAPPTMPDDIQPLNPETCILRVHVNCDGCRQKVKKILRKIEGVYSVNIDAEEEKVTVRGKVESGRLIRKLAKSGKHAEVWSATSNTERNGDSDDPSDDKRHQVRGGNPDPRSFRGGEDDFESWFQRYKNQLNEEEEWGNEIEEDGELLEYEMRSRGYDRNHQGYNGFYDGSAGLASTRIPGYLYHQHYPPSSSRMPDLRGYPSNGSWMRNGPNISSMMVDGHRHIHPTRPGRNAYSLRASHYGDY